jgi:hypothetical protein
MGLDPQGKSMPGRSTKMRTIKLGDGDGQERRYRSRRAVRSLDVLTRLTAQKSPL